jgi:hypothetical protein
MARAANLPFLRQCRTMSACRPRSLRVIYYYHSRRIPIFLLTAFAKNERDNLARDEIHQLAKAVKTIAAAYGG